MRKKGCDGGGGCCSGTRCVCSGRARAAAIFSSRVRLASRAADAADACAVVVENEPDPLFLPLSRSLFLSPSPALHPVLPFAPFVSTIAFAAAATSLPVPPLMFFPSFLMGKEVVL